jgi:hypothetical protein
MPAFLVGSRGPERIKVASSSSTLITPDFEAGPIPKSDMRIFASPLTCRRRRESDSAVTGATTSRDTLWIV